MKITHLMNKSFTQTKQCKQVVQMRLTLGHGFFHTCGGNVCESHYTFMHSIISCAPTLVMNPRLRSWQQYNIIEKIILTHINTNLTMIGLHVFSQMFYSIYTIWKTHSHHPHFQMMMGFWTLWICKHWGVWFAFSLKLYYLIYLLVHLIFYLKC